MITSTVPRAETFTVSNGSSQPHPVHRVSQKVRLVNVDGMEFVRLVDYSPVLIRADLDTQHRLGIGRVLLSVNVKPVLVFR
jgi:hypothetical protein